MSEYNYIKSELAKLGLSKNQAEIYLLLVAHKELRVQQIAKLTELPRSTVYENLKALFELGIIEEAVGDNYKSIRPYPITVLKHRLEETINESTQQLRGLDDLERAIAVTSPQTKLSVPVVRYYKGQSGARQLFWNTLKAKDTLYVFSEWGRGRYVGMKFYENFVAESKKRNVKEKVLINPTDHAIESIKTYTGTPISRAKIDSIRCIDQSKIHIKGEALMYDNIFAQAYLKNPQISGFEIESQQFVDTQRAIFETLWEQAEPLVDVLKRS